MARAKDLAGLAALGYLGFKLSQQGKGDTTSTRAARPESTETREDKDADKGYKNDVLKTITQKRKGPNDQAGNQGVLGGDKTRSIKAEEKSKPAAEDSPATTTTSSRAVPGGDAKRTESNKPMPSLRAVESRAASNKTDAMRNASRANVAAVNRMKAMVANPESQAVEAVYPELFLTPGGGFKTVAGMAKNLANRGGKEVAEYSTPLLAAPAKQLTGPSKADLMARDRAARASTRQEDMLRENARRSGLDPDNINPAVANKVRENMGGDDFSLGMKKGGAVKAKRMAYGGMASGGMTASRRGDGIATKGKTCGRIC
jgi:hypothetical protein